MTLYAELVCASHYSFLRGASPPAELIGAALRMNYSGLGLCDRNSVAGVVRALSALEDLRELRAKFLCVRKIQASGRRAAGLFRRRAGHCRLSRQSRRLGPIVPSAHARKTPRQKGRMPASLDDLCARRRRSSADRAPDAGFRKLWSKPSRVCARHSCRVWLGANMPRGGADRRRLLRLRRHRARRRGSDCWRRTTRFTPVPTIAPCRTSLTCVREHMTLAEAGRRLESNAERHLKAAAGNGAAVSPTRRRRSRRSATFSTTRNSICASFHTNILTSRFRRLGAAGLAGGADPPRRAETLSAGRAAKSARPARQGAGADQEARLRALFPHRPRHCRLRARAGTFCARGAAPPPIRRSATCSASPPSIRPKTICCSSVSFRRSGASRRTSMSISSMSGARR